MKKFFFDLNRNIATTSRLKTVCFEETYGRHILRKVIANLQQYLQQIQLRSA